MKRESEAESFYQGWKVCRGQLLPRNADTIGVRLSTKDTSSRCSNDFIRPLVCDCLFSMDSLTPAWDPHSPLRRCALELLAWRISSDGFRPICVYHSSAPEAGLTSSRQTSYIFAYALNTCQKGVPPLPFSCGERIASLRQRASDGSAQSVLT
jgi:hypothetical protein